MSRAQCFVCSTGIDPAVDARGLVWEKKSLVPGESVYKHGDEFRCIYIVQSGVIRTETETAEGRLNVTGFYTGGDLFGPEGIGSDYMPGRAVACNKSRVCEITYSKLLAECEQNPGLQHEFISRLGQRIKSDEYKWRIIRNASASHRLFYFLCDLQKRQSHIDSDAGIVDLLIEKQYITNFLGLTPETFSRALKKLEKNGAIEKVSHNRILISREFSVEST